jgi:hypothetical protein
MGEKCHIKHNIKLRPNLYVLLSMEDIGRVVGEKQIVLSIA